jgi:hypothetical protein
MDDFERKLQAAVEFEISRPRSIEEIITASKLDAGGSRLAVDTMAIEISGPVEALSLREIACCSAVNIGVTDG